MTNRQWLESLSDKELADNIYCQRDEYGKSKCCPKYVLCGDCMLDWLQAEHKEE